MTHTRILLFLFAICLPFLMAGDAYAQDPNAATALSGATAQAACHAAPFSPPCIGASIKDTATILGDRIVSPTFRIALIQGLLNISQFVVNRLAYEAALVVANGGPGQGSLFYGKSAGEGFAEFGLEVAGQSVAELSDAVNSSLGTKFDLCVPSGSLFSLSLQLGIKQKYQPEKPRCDIMEVIDNWDSFVSDAYSSVTDPEKIQSAIISKFAESLQPGRNELSAAVTFNLKVDQEVSQKKQLEKEERLAQNLKDVKDPVTKKTETPNKVVEEDFLDKIKKSVTGETTQLKASDIGSFGDAMGGLALTAASTFTNTLLSQLFNKIYSGLFDSSPDSQDPFNVEAIAETGQDPETFSRIFATTPVATASYNALTEFVVCPPQGIANRGLNNCVMDSSFLSAISRGSSGVPLTVQEAIDEGLINGKWPLISPENLSQNQDPLCYTYGFCYANLVKLRKARVLPIGWELAALRNSVSQPKTLQDIINEFNNCNQYGAIDAQHPFCHLIDPNWVLKYPDTQCRATVNGEIRLTQLSPGRQTVCADSPSCLGENSKGECVDGYGYCVREKNVWRFRGDECPAQYAGCLALRSTTTQQQHQFIVNTVNFSVCNQKNAGCQWYRTTKNLNQAATPTDPADDSYDWLLPNETYLTADRDDDWKYQQTDGTVSSQVSYAGTPSTYSYQERVYFTRSAQACSQSDAGCSELMPAQGAVFNGLRNPSFEQDEDKDGTPDKGIPDNWFLQSLQKSDISLEVNKPAARGSRSLKMLKTGIGSMIQYVPIKANQFYTFSFFGISDATGTIGAGQFIEVLDQGGKKVDLKGTALFGCSYDGNNKQILVANNVTKEWKRFSCTFSAPEGSTQVKIGLEADQNVRYDGIQLEPSEVMSDFVEGFSDGDQPQKTIKIAPDYLNCTGASTDSAACGSYAQMCQAQDVGCTLYTPDDGDPALPAITSPLDVCPAECVGYDTFKQERTAYESEKFPLYFIPTQAKSCSAQFVGCDSFTNLSSAAEGGEGVEYYTNLRACATEAMASGAQNKQKATFYTWEGSDNAGYQLRSWNLLESNLSDSASMDIFGAPLVNGVIYKEKNIGKAPCTKWKVSAKDQLVCIDDAPDDNDADSFTHQFEIQIDITCDEHADIFTNPDCREFFDANGFVHYRKFSQTITVSDQCQPYRKDQSTQTDCADAGGFWDAQVGFCRYFGLSSESAVCPAAANGCRAYTGGAGRNSVTILSETFENGSFDGFKSFETVAASNGLLVSNESIATDGHSLRVTAGGNVGGVATYHAYLNGKDGSLVFDPTNPATCKAPNKITQAGCEITPSCVVGPGEVGCGTFVNKIVKGDTFVVQFWAKGNGNIYPGFKAYGGTGDVYGLVTEASVPPITKTYKSVNLQGIALDGTWRAYQIGPFDSSKAKEFTKHAILFFLTDAGKTFYLDNLTVKQVEENITLVKNSWVVPSTCDTAPNGVNTPQYYLGCEAYTDQNAKSHNLYQFSKLCSEKVVGCEMFYQTFQSESPYSQIYHAQCVRGTKTSFNGKPTVDLTPPQVTTTPVDCVVNGETFCTIAAGRGSCTFDHDGTFDEKLPFDVSTGFGIVFGPETVVVPADRPVYIVDNGSADCSASSAGCQEVGKPKFAQDLSKVESFESAYFLNDPDQYGDILCDNEALFCDEYSSTKDGNFYFKSPMDKQCEYKTSVEIDGKKFAGWFRKGKSEPCYWTDVNPKDGKFTPGKDTAYITSGDQVSIWKNGDSGYEGWVGACSAQYDLCSEFIDIVDTEGGLKKDGTSYYFINNDKLTQAATQGSGACNGKVSQKAGCALFNNRSKAELNYNASVTYIVSTHADELLKKSPDALVDPVSCNGSGGVFKNKNGFDVDLCKSRCLYNVDAGDALTTNMSVVKAPGQYYERSCLNNSDCPVLKTKNDHDATGVCVNNATDAFKLANDSNTVLKVARDRSCSAWLACDSARTSFNERTNKYEPICDSIDLCVRGGALGQTAACTQWSARDPQILTDDLYSTRDVTWNGYELSGYAVPNQLPVELYDQFNLNPEKACVKSGKFVKKNGDALDSGEPPVACDDDCKGGGSCLPLDPDYRLVYNAGSCDSTNGNGGSCKVGHCSKTGNACSKNEECSGTDNKCVIGSCQETKPADNGKCPSGFKYDAQKDACVDKFLGEQFCYAGENDGCSNSQACIESATTAIGKCFNNRCLTDIQDGDGNGYADPITLTAALDQSCRGYPEVDSPYPVKVVEQWITPGQSPGQPKNELSKPYSYKTGYQDSKVCAIDDKGNPVDCDCSYDKIEYGQGAISLFESTGINPADVPTGFCTGGPFEGKECSSDKDCTDYTDKDKPDAGTCLKKTAQDTLYGWSGYCIEKDSSIQLYASTEAKDRACLTWLPVDQLSGATDLYAKYTSAGFEPKDISYCVDVGLAYDIGWDLDYHCAETQDGNCNDSLSSGAYHDDDPDDDVSCPPGFFAVMTGCGDASGGDKCEETWGDDDYPYFCVPRLAYHTKDAQGNPIENGGRCNLPPEEDVVLKDYASSDGTDIYFVGSDTWDAYFNASKDCKVKGVFENDATWQSYFGPPGQTDTSRASLEPYPACQSYLQVSKQSDDAGNLNAAWTNRVWEQAGFQIEGANKDTVGYVYDSQPTPFGRATDFLQKLTSVADPYPHRVAMCQKGDDSVLPFAKNGECPAADYQKVGVDQARSYTQVTMSRQTPAFNSQTCKNFNCICVADVDCNAKQVGGDPITCEQFVCKGGKQNGKSCQGADAELCIDDGGTCEGKCQGGAHDGDACADETACWDNICQQSYFSPERYCGAKTGTVYTLSKEADGENAAKKRLQQLFAQSYFLRGFQNASVYPDVSGKPDDYASIYDYLTGLFNTLEGNSTQVGTVFKENPIGNWKWDSRVIGDPETGDKPAPPKVWALGPCTGTKCREGKEGAITINDQDQGDVFGKAAKKITVSFFAAADSNQMPIRQIVVDWGDGKNTAPPWPTDSQSGSTATDNYYKNHRGLNSGGEEICSSDADEFGLAPEACSASYIAFSHDYVCTSAQVKKLQDDPRSSECKYAPDGRLLNSPCTDGKHCIYQPRVHVKDNWGWCTGFCNAGSDGTNGCFAGENFPGKNQYNNECNITYCPSKTLDGDDGKTPCPDKTKGTVNNPWVNYNGYVIIEPEV